jgi:hypothetical protein
MILSVPARKLVCTFMELTSFWRACARITREEWLELAEI